MMESQAVLMEELEGRGGAGDHGDRSASDNVRVEGRWKLVQLKEGWHWERLEGGFTMGRLADDDN